MLNKTKLKADIKKLLEKQASNTDQKRSIDEMSGGLADIFDAYIKSATIVASPAAVTASAMANGGGAVVASNNLVSTIS